MARPRRHRRWRLKPSYHLHAIDFTRYLGDEKRGIPPVDPHRLTVMVAGSSALYLTILEQNARRRKRLYRELSEFNLARFPRRPGRGGTVTDRRKKLAVNLRVPA